MHVYSFQADLHLCKFHFSSISEVGVISEPTPTPYPLPIEIMIKFTSYSILHTFDIWEYCKKFLFGNAFFMNVFPEISLFS